MNKEQATLDIITHQARVERNLHDIITDLIRRSDEHDASKLYDDEMSFYANNTMPMREIEAKHGFGSPEWQTQYDSVQKRLQLHYARNDHHPEHYQNGYKDMSLIAMLEMLADWKAAADLHQKPINLTFCKDRFRLSDEMFNSIKNTLDYLNWKYE